MEQPAAALWRQDNYIGDMFCRHINANTCEPEVVNTYRPAVAS